MNWSFSKKQKQTKKIGVSLTRLQKGEKDMKVQRSIKTDINTGEANSFLLKHRMVQIKAYTPPFNSWISFKNDKYYY